MAVAVVMGRPWLAPYAGLLAQLGDPGHLVADGDRGRVASRLEAVARLGRCPVRFTPATATPLPAAEYERCIDRDGVVPTRDNLHDFFNGLVWLRFPGLKRALHRAQAAAVRAPGEAAVALEPFHGSRSQRGPLRDALTLLDENGALLQAPERLVQALRRRDWQGAFVDGRSAWASATLVIVGHALLEKLETAPRPALTAHVWLLEDRAEPLAGKPFLPLPVLGVPGWWNPNQEASFYADASVFRPHRPPAGERGTAKALHAAGL
jgi:hypothetical protein